MKEKSFLKKWYNKKIDDWGGVTSEEYKQFEKDYRSTLKEIAKTIGFELHSFSKGHYNFSAVFKSAKDKFYYMSISDTRYWQNEWAERILYRTMEHDTDWTGGSNNYSTLEDLAENLQLLDSRS